jgi:hypothetical protein
VGGISFQFGGSDTKATLDRNTRIELTDVNRTVIRAGWAGFRHSLWRVDAYASGGLALALETFDGKSISRSYSGSKIRPLLGTEFGVRYQFDPLVFAGAGGRIEFGLDGRPTVGILLSGGVAFNPEGWF